LFKAVTRQDIFAALLLLLLPLLLFWPVTVGPSTLLPADNLFAHEPWLSSADELGVALPPHNQLLSDLVLENYVWKKFIRQSIADGQPPLWNPYILTGQPFLANGQHSALYPFSLLFYILPLSKAYGWFTVLQLWLAGLNMYIFVRVLRASRLGALAAAITYALSSVFVVQVVFTMIVAGAVWLPLLLAVIEAMVRKQEDKGRAGYSPIPFVVFGAAVLGVQTLAGHVEITYYTLLVSGFFALGRLVMLAVSQRTPRFALILGGWLLAMVLLGVGLGAVQLVPMYEVVSQNFRDSSTSLQQVREWALPLRRLITFAIPDFFGSPAHHGFFDLVSRQWQALGPNAYGSINPLCPNCTSWDTKTAVEAGAYAGILPLALALVAVVAAIGQSINRDFPASPLRRPVFIFTALALLSLLLAFGSPLYGLLFYGLPGWNQLHSPFRWIFPYTLSLAVLAGVGVTYLQAAKSPPNPPEGGIPLSSPPFGGAGGINFPRYLGWLLLVGGLLGLLAMLAAFVFPAPFIKIGQMALDRSGLAQHAFADGRQFFSYQWPHLTRFFALVAASGVVVWLWPPPGPSPTGRGGGLLPSPFGRGLG
jgi:hypothetical protein